MKDIPYYFWFLSALDIVPTRKREWFYLVVSHEDLTIYTLHILSLLLFPNINLTVQWLCD